MSHFKINFCRQKITSFKGPNWDEVRRDIDKISETRVNFSSSWTRIRRTNSRYQLLLSVIYHRLHNYKNIITLSVFFKYECSRWKRAGGQREKQGVEKMHRSKILGIRYVLLSAKFWLFGWSNEGDKITKISTIERLVNS
jgi:hypothetical protein